MKILLFIFACALSPIYAFANISVSPFYILFDSNAKARSDKLRFTNNSPNRTTYNIKMVNYRQDKNGKYIPIQNDDKCCLTATPYLEWAPHQVTLEPHESQVVRVQRRGMAGVPDGEYVSHLMIQEVPQKTDSVDQSNTDGIVIKLTPVYEVTIPVIIDKGDITTSAKISNIDISNTDNNPIARITVSRDGNKSFYGTLIIKSGRKEIGKLSKFRIFTTTPLRTLEIPLSQMPDKNISVILKDDVTDEILETRTL